MSHNIISSTIYQDKRYRMWFLEVVQEFVFRIIIGNGSYGSCLFYVFVIGLDKSGYQVSIFLISP